VIAADLQDAAAVDEIIRKTATRNVGLAVMNAGFGTSGYFSESVIEQELSMLHVNVEAVLRMTHHFNQKFIERQRGGIILLSSIVAFQGTPFAAHYAATKAYVQTLGEGIALESKAFGVDVLVASPGPVASDFGNRANLRPGSEMQAAGIAREILQALGKTSTLLPGLLTKVLVGALRTVPRWGKIRIMKLVMGGMTQHQRLSQT
jgi:uncharacterized protein